MSRCGRIAAIKRQLAREEDQAGQPPGNVWQVKTGDQKLLYHSFYLSCKFMLLCITVILLAI